ncbi:MAG: T9SS type A sorting domain-containing protein [Cytophagales bacterium]
MLKYLLFCSFGLLFSQPLHRYGFENFADEHEFTQANWTGQGFNVPWVNGFNNGRCHVDDAFSAEGTKSLRVRFDAGTFGPANNGAQAPLMVNNYDELYAGYWVRFSNNFSWGTTNEGGKLPGLSGGNRCSGCQNCNGTNGFTARLMWRPNGRGVVYLYHMDKAGACGDNPQLRNPDNSNFHFQKGVWYHVAQRLKINTVGQYNGEVETFINGQTASLITGLRFVTNADKVNSLYFSTFHGGADASWAPTVTCHIWFDDIIISTNKNDVLGTLSLQNEGQLNNNSTIKRFFFLENENLHIDLPEINQITIYDQNGKVMLSSNKSVIKTGDLPMGVYILKVETPEEILTRKLILKN